MWGMNAQGQWLYIGTQYVNNTLLTQEACERMIDPVNWSVHENNEYYRIQFDCIDSATKKE